MVWVMHPMTLNMDEELPDQLLESLVGINSVNPVYGGCGEEKIATFVKSWLAARGINYESQPVELGRENIVVRIGPVDEVGFLIEAHMDTVGVGGWETGSPFELRRCEDRLYGRGSCDTKASLACFMLTLSYFHANQQELRCPLIFAATVDEESKQKGAYELAKLKSSLNIGYAMTGEPTRSRVVARHKGACRYEVIASGLAAHGSTPELGSNAIYKMARICTSLEAFAAKLADAPCEREIERGSLNVGAIKGGVGFNVVPDSCTIDIDRRLGVGESPEVAGDELRDLIAKLGGADVRVFLERPPLVGASAGSIVPRLLLAADEAGEPTTEIEVAYMTNAVAYEEAGIASVVFGPGDIAQAHKSDEYIEVGEMERCISILRQFFRK